MKKTTEYKRSALIIVLFTAFIVYALKAIAIGVIELISLIKDQF